MIGVISHIEAMKERIDVQIKVTKMNGLGISKLQGEFAVSGSWSASNSHDYCNRVQIKY